MHIYALLTVIGMCAVGFVALSNRISNYAEGVNPTRLKEDLVALKPTMVANFTERTEYLYQVEQLVKGVLASEGAVTVLMNAGYQSFAKQIVRMQAKHPGGAQLDNDVAVKLAMWKARGYTEAILIRIRNEVFSIAAPAAP